MKILIAVLILLVITIGGFAYLSRNHYFCDSEAGRLTREKEEQARSLPKYPNTNRYEVNASCGTPDGTPSASVKFFTTDNKEKVEKFYPSHYINYDSRSVNQFKWWNVEIGF